jgi:hypothetical protein
MSSPNSSRTSAKRASRLNGPKTGGIGKRIIDA